MRNISGDSPLFELADKLKALKDEKKQKEIEKFRKALHVGQEVITAGGIHGIIRQIEEVSNVIVLEVAKDVKIRVDRACIYADSASAAQQQAEKK